jgi:hypothetical protein
MTTEEAKLILTTCRADQLDMDNPDVRHALEVAAAEPALAAWWEAEQAFDRAFARKLAGIQAPQPLQDAILRGGATIFAARRLITETNTDAIHEELIEKNTPPLVGDSKVVPFYQSPSEIQEISDRPPTTMRRRNWSPFLSWSVAASLLVGIFGLTMLLDPDKLTADSNAEIPAFTSEFAQDPTNTESAPEKQSTQLADMAAYLASRQAPQPEALPPDMQNDTLIGESVGHWKKDTVSIVRLQDAAGNLTLFVLNRTDFPNDKVGPDKVIKQLGANSVTTWSSDRDIYVLVRKAPASGS